MKFKNKILVIDDDKLQARILQNILTLNEYEVYVANSGALGIQKALEYNPDLILCDVKMDPIDGYYVFNVLKNSSMINEIPFIFITSNSDLRDIRLGMALGADDYFIKPFNKDDLLNAIENRLSKYRKLKEIGKREFNTVFRISPNGIFLFDGNAILNVNPALIEMLGLKADQLKYKTIEDLIDTDSYLKIENKINQCSKGLIDSFAENVFLKTMKMGSCEVCLHISVYEKFSSYSLMLGLFTPIQVNSDENDDFLSGVFGKLKKEKMLANESFKRHSTQVLANPDVKVECQGQGCFSKREIEVLRLSMEGLPIKLIADQLSISDRTVEKHRANLMEKTNSKNIIEVIVFALRNNLIEV